MGATVGQICVLGLGWAGTRSIFSNALTTSLMKSTADVKTHAGVYFDNKVLYLLLKQNNMFNFQDYFSILHSNLHRYAIPIGWAAMPRPGSPSGAS